MNNEKTLPDNDLGSLQECLNLLREPLDPLEASAIDGYLMAVLLQPQPIPVELWWPPIVDPDGLATPQQLAAPAVRDVRAIVLRRLAVLQEAMRERQWFDPWVFDHADDGDAGDGDGEDDDVGDNRASPSEAILPWATGFAMAMDLFPTVSNMNTPPVLDALALIYGHFDPADLEDADALLEIIEAIEPAATLSDAVEDLVSAAWLLADVTHPVEDDRRPNVRAAPRRGPPPARRSPPRRR
jgi:uncharacterized protein